MEQKLENLLHDIEDILKVSRGTLELIESNTSSVTFQNTTTQKLITIEYKVVDDPKDLKTWVSISISGDDYYASKLKKYECHYLDIYDEMLDKNKLYSSMLVNNILWDYDEF